MKTLRILVVVAAGFLFTGWAVFQHRTAVGDPDWPARLTLGVCFAFLLIARRRVLPSSPAPGPLPGLDRCRPRPGSDGVVGWPTVVGAVGSTVLAGIGIVLPVRQCQWCGVLGLMYACLRWALPSAYRADILRALGVLYWVNPLPGTVLRIVHLGMQRLSVQGAEWLLHALNVRVWADGLWLRTGEQVFGVPEACSGLQTGITVLLYTLGAGFLFRLGVLPLLGFVGVGAAQVIVLNVLRIAGMVLWAPRMPAEWSRTFLHDTLGILLLLSIVLIQLELILWRRAQERRKQQAEALSRGDIEPPERASRLPRFWTVVVRYARPILAIVLVLAVLAVLAYQRRPGHRAAMIAGILPILAENDPEAAERAAFCVQRLRGPDRELTAQRAYIHLRRGKFQEALHAISSLSGEPNPTERLIVAWALFGLGRADEGVKMLELLPRYLQDDPMVALLRAEHAARSGMPAEAARNAVLAAPSHRTIERVRNLFPYLAAHEQWHAISSCRHPTAFRDFNHLLLSLEADVRTGNLAGAAELLRTAWRQSPRDFRLMPALFALAQAEPGAPWEPMFAETLQTALTTTNADSVAAGIGFAFRLARPDLAWQAFHRLSALDPQDPALDLAAAQYAPVWFTFRRHHLRLPATHPGETVDRREEYARRRYDPVFLPEWEKVPLADAMIGTDRETIRQRHVKRALDELERREREGRLSLRLAQSYPQALCAAGRHKEALERLAELEKQHPERKSDWLLQQALIHDRHAQWAEAYETVRRYENHRGTTCLMSDLLRLNALINLDLPILAFDTAARIARTYPRSASVAGAQAAVWDAFGFKDQALFFLTREAGRREGLATAQLLYETGRIREAEKLARDLGALPTRRTPPAALLPAEETVTNRWPKALSEADVHRLILERENAAASCASPYVRELLRLEADWYRRFPHTTDVDGSHWARIGRDAAEQAQALYRLITLLAGTRHAEGIRAVLREALVLLPDSPILWRIQIALRGGDRHDVHRARKRCPDDPDIWLAWLVTEVRDRAGHTPEGIERLQREIESAVSSGRFSVETLTRAGHFLLRNNLPGLAILPARDAIHRARGWVPAYVLALQTALVTGDWRWARSCALAAIDHVEDPAPFYELIAKLGFMQGTRDADLRTALEYLCKHFPKEREWAEQLGHLYFHEADPARALLLLNPIVDGEAKAVRVHSLVLAAEAARLAGQRDRALHILETAAAAYPEHVGVLNNWIYTLAQDSQTLARARERLPELLRIGGNDPLVQDTAAWVYFQSGCLKEAEAHSRRALAGLRDGEYGAHEARLNAARIRLALGDPADAQRLLDAALRTPGCPRPVEQEARALRQAIVREALQRAVREAESWIAEGQRDAARRALKATLADPECPAHLDAHIRRLLKALDRPRPPLGHPAD